eukprot:jgi/Ulvmu1/8490/UM044_0024.1
MRAAASLFRAGRRHLQLAACARSSQQSVASRQQTTVSYSTMRGVVSEPSSWENIKEKVTIGTVESLGTLGRLPDHIEVYRAFRKKKLEEWDGMGSYLNHQIWGWEPVIDEDGKKTVHMPSDATEAPIWRANDFPYACQPGIDHHNIWCTIPLSGEQVNAVVEAHKPSSEYETLIFVNPVELQSIKAIWHAHVFSRRRPGSKPA